MNSEVFVYKNKHADNKITKKSYDSELFQYRTNFRENE